MSMLTNPLLNMGLGILSQSGPTRLPTGMAGIGQGAMLGLRNAQAMQQAQALGQLRLLKMKEAKQKAESLAAWQQNAEGMLAGAGFSEKEIPGIVAMGPDVFNRMLTAKPAAVRVYEYVAGLPPEKREDFFRVNNPSKPYYQFIPTPEGIVAGDARSGEIRPVPGPQGEPFHRSTDDPALQEDLAKAKTMGKGEAEKILQAGAAQARAEAVMQSTQNFADKVDKLLDHPGFDAAFGLTGFTDPRVYLPGREANDARVLRNQIADRSFVEALQNMRKLSKTGGAVGNTSDREGDKLENQMGALTRAQSDKQAREEFNTLRQILKEGQANIRRAFKLQFGFDLPGMPEPGMPEKQFGRELPGTPEDDGWQDL